MLNIGTGELIVIAVVALLVLGPKRLPELARGIGKFLREFRRQTDEVRGVVEREFYKMDNEINTAPPVVPQAAPGVVPIDGPKPDEPKPDAQQLALPMNDSPLPAAAPAPVAAPVPAVAPAPSPLPAAAAPPAAPVAVADAPEKKAS